MNASGRSSRRSCTMRANWWKSMPLPARKRGASSEVRTVASPRASSIVSSSVRDRAAERHLRVPEPGLEPLRDRLHVRRHVLAVQEQQVDVGVDAHLAARVAARPRPRRTRSARSPPSFEVLRLGQLEQAPHQADRSGPSAPRFTLRARLARRVERAQVLAPPRQVAARAAHARTSLGRWPQARARARDVGTPLTAPSRPRRSRRGSRTRPCAICSASTFT